MITLDYDLKQIRLDFVYHMGDKVSHKLRPEWGIGTIIEVCEKDQGHKNTAVYDYMTSQELGVFQSIYCYGVRYPSFDIFVGNHRSGTWYTAHENLIPVAVEVG